MNKQLFIFLIIILAIALLIWQFFWPAFTVVSQTREELRAWQDKLSQAQSLNEKLAGLKKKYQNLEKEVQRVADALPKNQDIPALLVQLEAMTSQNGLILNSVAFSFPETPKKKSAAGSQEPSLAASPAAASTPSLSQSSSAAALPPNVKIVGIELNLSGNYNSLKNFLKAVENSLRIMDVTAVDFGSSGTGGSETMPTFTVGLETYYR